MKKNKAIFFSMLCFALVFALAAYAMEMAKCPLCGMNIAGNENTAYEITYKDGSVVTYCCPHCGLYEHAMKKDMVKSARARCFISGEWIDPATATYIFNSEAVPACAPSWIGFGDKADAVKFQKGFGGTIYSFEEALTERAKMPKGMDMKAMKGMKM
jgi:DeoR family transcriptional regulator, copper-sensing transcriptional repressor